ncbi:MAG TPA: hypothetical protein PK971_12490 [Saprospiraceae bacterium]|nr:hypothetical protein [Saprospiraceae bacterium]
MKNTLQITLLLCLFGALSHDLFAQASGTKPELNMYRYNSLPGVNNPNPVVMGDTLGTLQFKGLTGPNATPVGASIRSFITGPVSPNVMPSNLLFRTSSASSGGQKNRMVITAEGLVGIGTMEPQYHLQVTGNTHTTGDFYGRIHFDKNILTNDAPNTYVDEAYFELKNRLVLTGGAALPVAAGQQGGVLTLGPGGAFSHDHQLYFGDNGIYTRHTTGNAANWTGADWTKLLSSGDISGTPNRIARFLPPDNPSSKIGDSQLFDDGARVGIRNLAPATDIDLAGSTRLNGNVGIGTLPGANRLEVLGDSRLQGNLSVSGAASTNSLNVSTEARVDGRLVIGNPPATPGGHALYVNGSVVCEEVKVALQADWPDYVFADGYTAPDPCEWEAFILQHRHLPGMPSAKEVEASGSIGIGETQRLLLEKIEQLTLMVIEQQKQIEALKK